MAVTSINLLGTDVMVKFNTLLAILSLLPTLIFTVYGLPELKPARLMQVEGDVDWSLHFAVNNTFSVQFNGSSKAINNLGDLNINNEFEKN